MPNTTLDLRLDADGAKVLIYEANGGETITVIVQAAEPESLDTVLEILGLDDRRLAYNDDHDSDLPDLAATDSVIMRLTLDAPGRYPILVSSFNGVSVGDASVTLTLEEPILAEVEQGDTQTRILVSLPQDAVYRYAFTLEDETVCKITARDPQGRLDPVLALLDAGGAVVVENDDHEGGSLTLNTFDARLETDSLPDGDYTLELREFLGRSGEFEIVSACQNGI